MNTPDLISTGVICADVMVRPVENLPPRGSLALVPHLEMHLGGLAGVTATVFSQLGGQAAFVGRIGRDSFGDYLLSCLEKNGVATDRVRRDQRHGSAATVVTITDSGERTFMHHMGTNAEVCEEDLDFDYTRTANVFHWGGPGITPKLEGEAMGRILAQLKDEGVTTSMDTCYDGKGVWLPLIEAALPHLDIVFSSAEEARHYTGQEKIADIAQFFLAYGVTTVVIKLGENGMYIAQDDFAGHIPAFDIEVVDTTGAGDAACGGFLYAMQQGWAVEQCGRFANAVGALTVQRMGGAEAIDSREQVEKFLAECPVRSSRTIS